MLYIVPRTWPAVGFFLMTAADSLDAGSLATMTLRNIVGRHAATYY